MKQLPPNIMLQLKPCNCYECQAMAKQGYIFFTYDLFGYYEALSKRVSIILKKNVIYYCRQWIEVKGLEI